MWNVLISVRLTVNMFLTDAAEDDSSTELQVKSLLPVSEIWR